MKHAFRILALLLLAAAGLFLVRREGSIATVSWRAGEITIEGELHVPEGEGPHPAVVVVPGHGCWTRSDLFFERHARRLADLGLAVLVYDKRGCGASGGDWRRASLARLADDALAGHALLRDRIDVDPERVGLLGTSQGAAVALLAAAREPSVAFVATASLSLRPPREHDAFLVAERVRRAGLGEQAATRAEAVFEAFLEAARTGTDFEAKDELRAEPWFEVSGLGDLLGSPWQVEAYRALPLDLDARSLLLDTTRPVFAAQGLDDWVVPGEREARLLREIAAAGPVDLTVVAIPDAGHGLRRRGPWPLRHWTWPSAYWDALEGWLRRKGF